MRRRGVVVSQVGLAAWVFLCNTLAMRNRFGVRRGDVMGIGKKMQLSVGLVAVLLLAGVTAGCAAKPTQAQQDMAARVEAAASKTEAAANKAEAAARSAAEAAARAEAAAAKAESMFHAKVRK